MPNCFAKCAMFELACALSLFLSGCAHYAGQPKISKEAVFDLVGKLPASDEKAVALAILNNADSEYRVDHHGYPTWRWRGDDDIGGCVHIDPKSGQPYLENQFPISKRTKVPKYINFGTTGHEWQCRIHQFTIGKEIEKNWSTAACHADGKALLHLLHKKLLNRGGK